jgi:hypothetical protein
MNVKTVANKEQMFRNQDRLGIGKTLVSYLNYSEYLMLLLYINVFAVEYYLIYYYYILM